MSKQYPLDVQLTSQVLLYNLQPNDVAQDHQHKRTKFLVQNCIKRNCPATIHVREIRRFEEFQVSEKMHIIPSEL